jgi:hypothetical protein
MDKSSTLNQSSENLNQRKFYHGTPTELLDDYLQPKKNFNSLQNAVVSGAFVTSDEAFAKFFAINHCIGMGHTNLDHNKIYLERLSNNIIPEFYVYIVYETPDNQFVHDRGTEYYSTKPIKIAYRKKFNTVEEIKRIGYEIYVLNEPLKHPKGTDTNFNVQQEMQDRIDHKQFHRVDIASMIEQQSNNRLQTMFHKTFLSKND